MAPIDITQSTRRTEFLLTAWANYKVLHIKKFPAVPLFSVQQGSTAYFRVDMDSGEAKLGAVYDAGIPALEAEHKLPGCLMDDIQQARADGQVPVLLGLYVWSASPLHVVWKEPRPALKLAKSNRGKEL